MGRFAGFQLIFALVEADGRFQNQKNIVSCPFDLADRFRDKAERIAESLKLALFYRPGSIRPRAD